MDSLKGMYYIDYILYMYISHAIYKSERNARISMPDSNLQYFLSMINNIKGRLDAKGHPLEEEILVKYIIFLAHYNIVTNFFTRDINRKFYKVFDYLKKSDAEFMTKLKRVVIWGYNGLLVEKGAEEWEEYSLLCQEECDARIDEIMKNAKIDDSLIEGKERENFFTAFNRKMMDEIAELLKKMNIPLLSEMNQTGRVRDVMKEILSHAGSSTDTDMVLWHGGFDNSGSVCIESEDENVSDTDAKQERVKPRKPLLRRDAISFTQRYRHIDIESMFSKSLQGVEVEWDESIPEEKEKSYKRQHRPDPAETSANIIKRVRKSKRVWTSKETEILIDAIKKHGPDWSVVYNSCGFKNTTREQIIDKYKSLIRSKKIERVSRKLL
ncbi:uncharacterized protein NEMAJ01_1375 [Nematocida major]|uniref:uncharacterized protein n=1 Tax=Nematocida major TaxID=1912982 RepID=UPI0020073989|nr:uncharacterized protein NEMAJ01_1375 [Nematocida major]KAH9386479.1 hypothetical protein NEMAJ01_1375 [Nematocida major]